MAIIGVFYAITAWVAVGALGVDDVNNLDNAPTNDLGQLFFNLMDTYVGPWAKQLLGIMLLKEPWGLPILLRWAKEDFYLAPAVALVIGIAVARVESRALRMTLTAAAVLTSLLLRLRDFGYHIDTLRFLR